MSFSDDSKAYLIKMGIDPDKYHAHLSSRFIKYVDLIDLLITTFQVRQPNSLKNTDFNLYIKQYRISDESDIFNHAYEILNYIRLFKLGGRFGLFKDRQAEWQGPIVVLRSEDVPESDLEELTDGMSIYRGMSEVEFGSRQFGQSWTTNFDVAKRFAEEIYSDLPQGIVAKANLDKSNAIFHCKLDCESEVIMAPQRVELAARNETS